MYRSYEDIDRAAEEKARGITINICHVGYSTEHRTYSHTDCPGHIDYIKNMIVGGSQMDGAILVVAATDGTMPQTREHLMLVKQLGVEHLVVYVNKADLVTPDVLELVELEVLELLEEHGYKSQNVAIINGSALCALQGVQPEIGRNSIFQLLDALDKHIPMPVRPTDKPFIMPVEKAISVPGRGTVVVGTASEGTIKSGDSVKILGHGQKIKSVVSGIEIFGESAEEAKAGDNVGLLLRRQKKSALVRGMTLCHPHAGLDIRDAFKAQVYVRTKAEGGRSKPIVRNYINPLFSQAWNTRGCVVVEEGTQILMPGDSIETTVLLQKSMVIREGDRFFIRDDQLTTISGVILKLLPPTDMKIVGFNVPDRRRRQGPVIESNAQVVQKKKYSKMAARQTKTKAK